MGPLIAIAVLVAVPLAEIAVFIEVGGLIGTWPTIALAVLTAVLGTALIRRQGIAVVATLRDDLDHGRAPIAAVVDGAFLLVAGALLITPGFLTDTIGFLLLVPAIRRIIQRLIAARLAVRAHTTIHVAGDQRRGRGRRPTVIDGEFVEVEPRSTGKPRGGSPRRHNHLPPSGEPESS